VKKKQANRNNKELGYIDYHRTKSVTTQPIFSSKNIISVICNCNCNWGTCIVPPTRRPRAHHRVNPYLGARRQSETKMFSDHDETSPSIAAVSAPSVACSTLAVQQHCPRQQPITKHVRAATDNLSQSPTPVKFKHVRQDAQLSQKVDNWNWETIFYGQYRSIFSHCDIIGRKIYRISWKNAK